MEPPHLVQQLAAGHRLEPRGGQDQCDLHASVSQRPQIAQRLFSRAGADHAVAASVAVVELALEQLQRGLVFVDERQHRELAHHRTGPAPGRASSGDPGARPW